MGLIEYHSEIAKSIDTLTYCIAVFVACQVVVTFAHFICRYYVVLDERDKQIIRLNERITNNEYVVQTLFDFINQLNGPSPTEDEQEYSNEPTQTYGGVDIEIGEGEQDMTQAEYEETSAEEKKEN